jgi:Glycosyltransferase family 28 C-terminal domain
MHRPAAGSWRPLQAAAAEAGGGAVTAELVVLRGDVSHAELLPRCALLISHGGAGTVAAALQTGTPQLVCPFHFDQFFWVRPGRAEPFSSAAPSRSGRGEEQRQVASPIRESEPNHTPPAPGRTSRQGFWAREGDAKAGLGGSMPQFAISMPSKQRPRLACAPLAPAALIRHHRGTSRAEWVVSD